MSSVNVNFPDDLRHEIADRVAERGITESQWLEEAAREKLTSDAELKQLELRAVRGSRAAFERVLAKVPDVDPSPGD